MHKLVSISALLLGLAACGENLDKPDAPVAVDSPPMIDAPQAFVPPTPFAFNLSATGIDQMQSATGAPNGGFYTAGFTSTTIGMPLEVIVMRVTSAGAVDTTWGTNGQVATTLVTAGGSDEIDIATQSDGKIIVASTVINAGDAADRDIAIVRIDPTTEALDATFGAAGVRLLDLSTTGTGSTVVDASRGLAVDSNNNIYVHGIQKAEGTITGGSGPRIDSDFVVVKLTPAGAVDTNWGASGKRLTDIFIGGLHSGATARGIIAFADGSVIAGGYSNAIGTTQPVLYKLTPTGGVDAAFASGMFHDTILALQTEVYGLALHGTNIVTAGYGRNTGTTNDWVSLRFDTTTGVRDTTWGGAALGAVLFDPSGTMAGSNCRNAIALPDGRTVTIGSTGPSNMPAQDAVFAVLDATGHLDTANFGTGIVKYAFTANSNDQLWGGAVSGGNVLVIGYKGGLAALASQTTTANDDAYGVLLPLP